ncbi:unnamed protein product [Paramecium sonneborni]|uniref:Casein kinase I n=1 Tax=Paramecium sonneborni TaxID=65129 RepID=A0A8S1MY99_9CILI|nr:unnamed protein product [Paramecium sonneborni]
MQLKIPQYKILQKIGCGSEHQVYKAEQTNDSEIYAIKIEKSAQIGQLQNENLILEKLNGIQGIPEIKQFGLTAQQKCFIILPLFHCNLLDLVKSKPLSFSYLLIIGLKVIEILEKVHKKNILHLDIKPENIMLSKQIQKESDILQPGLIQLIDFGLSQQFNGNSESLQDVFIGSLNFASRSSHDGSPLGYKDDLESLIYVLYYLKDLRLPWSEIQLWGLKDEDTEFIKKSKFSFVKTIIYEYKSPLNFSRLMSYIDSLKYDIMPNYVYIKDLFMQMITASNGLFSLNQLKQQLSYSIPTQSQFGDSEILRLSKYDIFDDIVTDDNSEENINLIPNLILKYQTKQIKSIKNIQK